MTRCVQISGVRAGRVQAGRSHGPSSGWRRAASTTSVALLLALAPAPAFAEDTTDLDADAEAAAPAPRDPAATPVRLPGLTVIGAPEDVFALPGSGTVLTVEELREQAYDDVNQVLRAVPGVYIRQEDGFGLFPNLSLRGVDTGRSAKISMMEDGVLTAPAPYASPAAYYSPSVGRMHAVEVLKGSSQIRYGPHTTGGVVNFVSTPIPEGPKGYFRGLYGEENEMRAHGYWGNTVETSLGSFGYLLEGYARHSNGFKRIDGAPNFTDRGDTGFTLAEPMLKLSWTPRSEREQRFELKLGYTKIDADETYLGLSEADFENDPFRRYAASRFDNFEASHFRSYLRHFLDAGWGVDLTTTVYGNYFERNWFKLHDLRGIEDSDGPPGSTVNMSLSSALAGANGGFGLDVLKGERAGTLRVRNNDREYFLYGAETVANRVFEMGSLTHDVSAGIRFHTDRESRDQLDEFYAQDDDGRILGRTLGPRGGAGDRWEQTRAIAVFVEDAIEWRRFTFRPGIRYEQLWVEYKDHNEQRTDSGRLGVWAPGLGITYDVAPEWVLLGGVHRGFSVPSPRDHLISDLDEETSIATELGVRYAGESNGLEASVIGFFTAFDDLIVLDNIGGSGSATSENVGSVNSYGVELGLNFDLGVNRGWSFSNPYFVNFTYTLAELDGDSNSTDAESLFSGGKNGNRAPYVPEYLVNFGAGVEFDRWGFAATGTWVDETFTTASNTTRQIDANGEPDSRFGTTDSYFLLDLTAHVKVRDGVKLLGGIHNVTDKEYLASRHPHGPRPGQPRFAYVGLEFTY